MLTLLGCPLRLALVRARALPEPRAMLLINSKSGTRTPILSKPGFRDFSKMLESPEKTKRIQQEKAVSCPSGCKVSKLGVPRLRTRVTGPGRRL